MSEFPRPRLPIEVKREVVRRIVACTDEEEAGKIAERLWAALRGDMQDRITTLIHAAKGAVESEDMNARRGPLKDALRLLRDSEAAAMEFPPGRENRAGARSREGQDRKPQGRRGVRAS